MMHTAVFAVMGLTVLSLAASHPTPDYKARENHASLAEAHLRDPHVPLLAKNDFLRQQPRQLGSLATALLLTPLLLGGLGGGGGILGGNQGGNQGGGTFGNQGGGLVGNQGGGTVGGGLGRLNRTSADNIKAYVVNIPGSPVPHLVVTQRHGNPGVPSALPSGAFPYVPPFVTPLEPPYASPMAVPLPYPSIVHGNVLPTQHFVSGNQLFVPILPSYEGKKEDIKPVIEKSVDESSSFRSGAMESS